MEFLILLTEVAVGYAVFALLFTAIVFAMCWYDDGLAPCNCMECETIRCIASAAQDDDT